MDQIGPNRTKFLSTWVRSAGIVLDLELVFYAISVATQLWVWREVAQQKWTQHISAFWGHLIFHKHPTVWVPSVAFFWSQTKALVVPVLRCLPHGKEDRNGSQFSSISRWIPDTCQAPERFKETPEEKGVADAAGGTKAFASHWRRTDWDGATAIAWWLVALVCLDSRCFKKTSYSYHGKNVCRTHVLIIHVGLYWHA